MVAGDFSIDGIESANEAEIKQFSSTVNIVFAAASVESRCTQIPRIFNSVNCLKVAFEAHPTPIPDETEDLYAKNVKHLQRAGFQIESYSLESLRKHTESFVGKENETFHVFMDVTCLPRRAIAEMICEISSWLHPSQKLELVIGYTLARYTPPPANPLAANKRVAPAHPMLSGGWTSAKLPVTAIAGLGYEKGKALGAVEYLQAQDIFLFLPSSPELRYRPKLEKHNRLLLKQLKAYQVIDYDVVNPVQTLLTMDSLVTGVKQTAKPVLLPFGPKIFFALSVLVGLAHREAAVWHVSGEESELPEDRPPTTYSFAIRCQIGIKKIESPNSQSVLA